MPSYRDSRITRIVIGIFFIVVLGYAYFELRGILFGPTITITSSTEGTRDPLTHITGSAARIASLLMNGKAVPVTETGSFDEPYLLAPGLNLIILEATDKYGGDHKSVVQIVYTPLSTASSTFHSVATTTASSTVAQ